MIEERLFRLFLFSREERTCGSKNFVLTFFQFHAYVFLFRKHEILKLTFTFYFDPDIIWLYPLL